MDGWFSRNIVEPGKLPLFLCLMAFVLTFLITRSITRLIRAGIGPFRNVSAGGTHVHHAVPGILALIVGSLLSLAAAAGAWIFVAAVLIGIGMSLVLDEFALILHLQDVYWQDEGRLSVELVGLTVACVGLVLVGFSPFGVDDLGTAEIGIRVGIAGAALVQIPLIMITVLKGKYRSALLSCFVPLICWVTAFRLARPTSWWARRWYGPDRRAHAAARAQRFDARWSGLWDRVGNVIAGKPTA